MEGLKERGEFARLQRSLSWACCKPGLAAFLMCFMRDALHVLRGSTHVLSLLPCSAVR